MFVVARVSVRIMHVINIEGEPVSFRNVVIGNNPVTRDITRLNLVSLSTPKDMKCTVIYRGVSAINKGGVPLPLGLEGHREEVFPVQDSRCPDIFRIVEAQPLRGGLAQFEIFYGDTLVAQGLRLVISDAVLALIFRTLQAVELA